VSQIARQVTEKRISALLQEEHHRPLNNKEKQELKALLQSRPTDARPKS
jgi:DNA recombination-dependent growth factor C